MGNKFACSKRHEYGASVNLNSEKKDFIVINVTLDDAVERSGNDKLKQNDKNETTLKARS